MAKKKTSDKGGAPEASAAKAAEASAASNKAAIVHLFFLNNWFHDWYYDSGFNEAAGNAQKDNYGRGAPGGARRGRCLDR